MKKKIILYPPTLDYNFLFQRPQQMLRQAARNGWTVIFCNNTQSKSAPEEVEPNLYVYHDFQDVLNKIKHKQLKIDVYYYTWAKCAEYVEQIKAKVNVYDSVDSFEAWYQYEDQAVETADIVLTSSQFLFDLRSKKHSNTYLVRNACPASYIGREASKPSEYNEINGPIAIFSGAIGSWVDTRLIRKVADKYTTVLVGQEFGKECPSNVIKIGTKNHDELYNYYAFADVCLLPFNTALEVTQAACAIKMFEHMAAGKITVATAWNETNIYPDSVFTAETHDEFLGQVDKAIRFSNDEFYKRKSLAYARENTWENRFTVMNDSIMDYCAKEGVVLE